MRDSYLFNTATVVTAASLCLLGMSRLSAQDLDSDTIPDAVEQVPATFGAVDLTLTEVILRSDKVTTRNAIGILEDPFPGTNLVGVSFNDDAEGFGYYRITQWTGDQSAAKGGYLNFGVLALNLGASFATTSDRDVVFVGRSGSDMEMNVQHGIFERLPSAARFNEVFQVRVPLVPETFGANQGKFDSIMEDLDYIEIRGEFWSGPTGKESVLLPAGVYASGFPDSDGDGTQDYLDTDSDGDGLTDEQEGVADPDHDGLGAYVDLDSDNDGLLDALEGLADTDGDGTRDSFDTDSDNDGLLDRVEGTGNIDDDGLANYLDPDSDNDSIPDALEGLGDVDNDGLANYLDTDSDNDGRPDGIDGDADGDGISNAEEAWASRLGTNLVENGDFLNGDSGFTSSYTGDLSTLDAGGVVASGGYVVEEDPADVSANFTAFADDNAGGMMMVVFTGVTPNELVWSQEVNVNPGATYAFSAAVATTIPGLQPVLDFRVDGVSLGVPLEGEAPGEWVSAYATYRNDSAESVTLQIYSVKTTVQQSAFGLDSIALVPFSTDVDGDGSANFLDSDADGDTLVDSIEGTIDTDSDGIANYLDEDSDNDTIPDRLDGVADLDGDGTPAYKDLDSDNDLVSDQREGSGDIDNDGIPDNQDTDSDNDGIPDAPGEDSDGDGIYNEEEGFIVDTDDDGTPNYLDLDSDGDGIPDSIEFLNDSDRDGLLDYIDHQPSFVCTGFAMQSYNAPTQFALVDVNGGVFVNVGNTDHQIKYNAIAYNPSDNYIYGLNRSTNDPELVRIGSDGSIAKIGLISGLPRSYVAGTFDSDGIYWVSGAGNLYGIDVRNLAVLTQVTHSPKTSGSAIDLAYNPVTDTLYGSTGRGQFFSVERETGATTILGNNGKTFGALICDFNGVVYGFDNKGTGAFRVNLKDGSTTWMASSPKTGVNDGTICPSAILTVDTDGDGISDEFDLDDDNDGTQDIFESVESNDPNGDEDGDGIRNWTDFIDDGNDGDGSGTVYTDDNGDGIPNVFDVDGDGRPNHLDEDADGDGIPDSVESFGDTDSDGIPDALDPDADDDGVPDSEEGVVDADGDGIKNFQDPFDNRDEDGDGIANGHEGTGDADGDSIPNHLDTDSDNDGVLDKDEIYLGAILDSDGDGAPNFLDIDDDNDGIPTLEDDCPLCNFADNVIQFDISDPSILASYGIDPTYYSYARDVWNEVKTKLNCNTQGVPLEDEKRGFDEERFFVEEDSEVLVTVIYDGASFVNSVAWYDASDPESSWRSIWQKYGTGPLAPLLPGSTVSLGVLPAETELRFGLVMDGGNGGTSKIYQDAFLNPAGMDFFAGRTEVETVEGDPIVVAFEDQLHNGRDNDFNDVIFMVNVVPAPEQVGQFGDNALGSAGVSSRLALEGMDSEAFEKPAELFRMPSSGLVTVDLLADESAMDFSLAIFDYSTVELVVPDILAFREISAQNATTILDDRVADVGTSVTIDPVALGLAGKDVGLMLIPSNTVETFLTNPFRYTPRGDGNDTKRQPLYSISSANPGQHDQFLVFSDSTSTLVTIEDLARLSTSEAGAASDHDFDDVQVRFTPALETSVAGDEDYYQSSTDVTIGWDGIDGYSGSSNGDF